MDPVILILAIILLLAAFLLIRMYFFIQKSSGNATEDLPGVELPQLELDKERCAQHLADSVKIETITHEDPAEDILENFFKLHHLLERSYPNVKKAMKREVIGRANLLYTWKGKNPDLEPVLFTAHQDVVPAEENTLDQWSFPPFSGKIVDGVIWGRGTLDIKCQLISLLEAAEALIAAGYTPERTVLFAFGCDEEILGNGAKDIVAELKERGIHLAAMVDEGGGIYDGVLPGIKGYVATVGVAEKGYLSLKVWVDSEGGHSSTPSEKAATAILVRALERLVSNPFPAKLGAVVKMYEKLGSALTTKLQFEFSNRWLLGGLLKKQLLANSETAATLRTTTAVTILKGGVKDNILPGHAEAVVNFRVMPGESIASVCEYIRKTIDDERVQFEPLRGNAWEASPISPDDSLAYQHLVSAIHEFFPEIPCAPFIQLGGTDARNYYGICSNVYRFSLCVTTPADLNRVHGVNECITVDALAMMVDYFYRLIPRWAEGL